MSCRFMWNFRLARPILRAAAVALSVKARAAQDVGGVPDEAFGGERAADMAHLDLAESDLFTALLQCLVGVEIDMPVHAQRAFAPAHQLEHERVIARGLQHHVPARFQHPPDLAQGGQRVGDVFDHVQEDHHIGGIGGQRRLFQGQRDGVEALDLPGEGRQLAPGIDPGGLPAVVDEPAQQEAQARADLDHMALVRMQLLQQAEGVIEIPGLELFLVIAPAEPVAGIRLEPLQQAFRFGVLVILVIDGTAARIGVDQPALAAFHDPGGLRDAMVEEDVAIVRAAEIAGNGHGKGGGVGHGRFPVVTRSG